MAYKKNFRDVLRDERKLLPISGYVGKYHMEKLKEHQVQSGLPISRLVGIAIDNEFLKDNPFEFDCSLPESEYIEYAFADEAGKILTFLKGLRNGLTLDALLLLRHDVGIPDKDRFMNAFRECLEMRMIEIYIAPKSVKYNHSFGDIVCYRIADSSPRLNKKIRSEAEQYVEMLRLQKKFAGK